MTRSVSPKPPPPSLASSPSSPNNSPKPHPPTTTSPKTSPNSAALSPPRCSSQIDPDQRRNLQRESLSSLSEARGRRVQKVPLGLSAATENSLNPFPPRTQPSTNTPPLTDVYNVVDLPLVPVLLRMEQTGVRVNLDILREQSPHASGVQIRRPRRADLQVYRVSLQRRQPQANSATSSSSRIGSPQAAQVRQGGKVVSTARDTSSKSLRRRLPPIVSERPRAPSALQAQRGTYLDALPAPARRANHRIHTTFVKVGTATGRLEAQPTPTCRPSRSAPRSAARSVPLSSPLPATSRHVRRLLADRAPPRSALLAGPAPPRRLPAPVKTSTRSPPQRSSKSTLHHEQRDPAPAPRP